MQLISTLEDAELNMDPERAPKYRVPKSAYTAPSKGSRRWRRLQKAGHSANESLGEDRVQPQAVMEINVERPVPQGGYVNDTDFQDALMESAHWIPMYV